MVNSTLPPQCQLGQTNVKIPRYRFARIPLNNYPSGAFSITPTGSIMLEHRLSGNSVFNLSRSLLSYQYQVPAGSAGLYPVVHEVIPANRVTFGDIAVLACDIQNAGEYYHSVVPYNVRWEDFIVADKIDGFYPSRVLATNNLLPISLDGLTTGVLNNATMSYTEPQHLQIGSSAATAYVVTATRPLSHFKDTILGMDKDQVFPADTFLRIYTQLGQRLCYYTSTPASPQLPANVTLLTNNVPFINWYLYLALEQNDDLKDQLLRSLATGALKYKIPYTYVQEQTTSAGSSSNITLPVTSAYGGLLKKIIFACYNGNLQNGPYSFDSNNSNGCKYNQIQVLTQNRPMTDMPVRTYNPYSIVNPGPSNGASNIWAPFSEVQFCEDWRENLQWIQGSSVQSYPQHQLFGTFFTNFGVPDYKTSDKMDGLQYWNNDDGLNLENVGNINCQVQLQTPAIQNAASNCNSAGIRNNMMIVYSRTLIVSPGGIGLAP